MPGSRRGGELAAPTLEGGAVVGFKARKGGIEHFPARNDDDVEARGSVLTTKYLPTQALDAVSIDRGPNFSRRRYTEPSRGSAIRQQEQGHEPAVNACSCFVNTLEVHPAPNTPGGRQSLPAHGSLLMSATIPRQRQSAACGPSPGDA
jgi:hypothetical protein